MPGPYDARTLPHIVVTGRVRAEAFTRPGVPVTPRRVLRERFTHANRLLAELDEARAVITPDAPTAPAALSTEGGLILEFESHPDFTLKLQTLDARRSGFELLNVRTREVQDADADALIVELATVKVASGALTKLVKKLTDFRDELTTRGRQWKNRDFVLPIEHIRRATLEALWNEEPGTPMPARGVVGTWEAWLNVGEDPAARDEVVQGFYAAAADAGILVQDTRVDLPETTVLLIRATQEQIAGSWAVLDCLQELRSPAITAEFFLTTIRPEQRNWIDHLRGRVRGPQPGANAVCLLDSGINHGHPLLSSLVPPDGLHTYSPAWGTGDGWRGTGHGTLMAGLAAYGDLTPLLSGNAPVEVGHYIESVRMLAPDEATRLNEKLWPDINRDSVARIEGASQRKRVFAQQITGLGKALTRGKPTAWSATMDQLASGAGEEDMPKRLFCFSAGNTFPANAAEYPAVNETAEVHDPAQAWNVLTVGGYTQLIRLAGQHPAGSYPLAGHGALAPVSTTSLTWRNEWPLKPEIVAEAGNLTAHADGTLDTTDDLSLLSTSAQVVGAELASTGDTSAASALVARLAANMQRQHPDLWPETIRALLVHSAEWTDAMRAGRPLTRLSKTDVWNLLRTVGYGVPNETKALRSAQNAPTLLIQGELQPYRQREDDSVVTHELNLHQLPWPQGELARLGEQTVRLRVTLSYFIEPNPGRRLTNQSARYASTNLRFDMIRPLESEREFRARINKQSRDEEYAGAAPTDGNNWLVGSSTRHRGSLHADIWCGPASQLANKTALAVYPVGGWWKLRPKLGRANSRVRYGLVVSIEAPEVEIDLHATVAAMVRVPVPIMR